MMPINLGMYAVTLAFGVVASLIPIRILRDLAFSPPLRFAYGWQLVWTLFLLWASVMYRLDPEGLKEIPNRYLVVPPMSTVWLLSAVLHLLIVIRAINYRVERMHGRIQQHFERIGYPLPKDDWRWA